MRYCRRIDAKRKTDEPEFYAFVPMECIRGDKKGLEPDFVCLSIDEYDALRRSAGVREDERTVVISESEYNGYLNAIRVIKDRALQQVSKSEADEHGYKFLRSRRRWYMHENDRIQLWLVTKQTPYSVKMPVDVVERSVLSDLETSYNSLITITDYRSDVPSCGTPIKDMFSLLRSLSVWRGEKPAEVYKPLLSLFENKGIDYRKPRVIIELSELNASYAAGVYEVTYWATDVI